MSINKFQSGSQNHESLSQNQTADFDSGETGFSEFTSQFESVQIAGKNLQSQESNSESENLFSQINASSFVSRASKNYSTQEDVSGSFRFARLDMDNPNTGFFDTTGMQPESMDSFLDLFGLQMSDFSSIDSIDISQCMQNMQFNQDADPLTVEDIETLISDSEFTQFVTDIFSQYQLTFLIDPKDAFFIVNCFKHQETFEKLSSLLQNFGGNLLDFDLSEVDLKISFLETLLDQQMTEVVLKDHEYTFSEDCQKPFWPREITEAITLLSKPEASSIYQNFKNIYNLSIIEITIFLEILDDAVMVNFFSDSENANKIVYIFDVYGFGEKIDQEWGFPIRSLSGYYQGNLSRLVKYHDALVDEGFVEKAVEVFNRHSNEQPLVYKTDTISRSAINFDPEIFCNQKSWLIFQILQSEYSFSENEAYQYLTQKEPYLAFYSQEVGSDVCSERFIDLVYNLLREDTFRETFNLLTEFLLRNQSDEIPELSAVAKLMEHPEYWPAMQALVDLGYPTSMLNSGEVSNNSGIINFNIDTSARRYVYKAILAVTENRDSLTNPDFIHFFQQFNQNFYSESLHISYFPQIVSLYQKMLEHGYDIEIFNSEEVSQIIDFIKQEFDITFLAPNVYECILFLLPDFDLRSIRQLIQTLRDRGESIKLNDLMLLNTISQSRRLTRLFNHPNRLNSQARKAYRGDSFPRPHLDQVAILRSQSKTNEEVDEQINQIEQNYTERPALEELSTLSLIRIVLLKDALQNRTFLSQLASVVTQDIEDDSTEFGGLISFNGDEFNLQSLESTSEANHGFSSYKYSSLLPGFVNFHLHAFFINSGDYSGPSGFYGAEWGDITGTGIMNQVGVVFTTMGHPVDTSGNPISDQIIINADMYWIDERDAQNPVARIVDFGTVTLPFFAQQHNNEEE